MIMQKHDQAQFEIACSAVHGVMMPTEPNNIRGWGGDTNWEIVSSRLCLRTRSLVVEWNFASNVRSVISGFAFPREPFPFPL